MSEQDVMEEVVAHGVESPPAIATRRLAGRQKRCVRGIAGIDLSPVIVDDRSPECEEATLPNDGAWIIRKLADPPRRTLRVGDARSFCKGLSATGQARSIRRVSNDVSLGVCIWCQIRRIGVTDIEVDLNSVRPEGVSNHLERGRSRPMDVCGHFALSPDVTVRCHPADLRKQ